MCPVTGEGRRAPLWREMIASTMALVTERDAPIAAQSQMRACSTAVLMGRTLSSACLPAAQVRTVHQLRQALRRVVRALPSGEMCASLFQRLIAFFFYRNTI